MTAVVGFTVDRDYLEDDPGKSAVDTTWGPDLATAVPITEDTPGAVRWYARDDDDILYYSGLLVGDCWEVVLEWGTRYAGVAAIYDDEMNCIVG